MLVGVSQRREAASGPTAGWPSAAGLTFDTRLRRVWPSDRSVPIDLTGIPY
jgi:hypothetical protein